MQFRSIRPLLNKSENGSILTIQSFSRERYRSVCSFFPAVRSPRLANGHGAPEQNSASGMQLKAPPKQTEAWRRQTRLFIAEAGVGGQVSGAACLNFDGVGGDIMLHHFRVHLRSSMLNDSVQYGFSVFWVDFVVINAV